MEIFSQNSAVRKAVFQLVQTIEHNNYQRVDFGMILFYVRTKAKQNGYIANTRYISAEDIATILVELGYLQYKYI